MVKRIIDKQIIFDKAVELGHQSSWDGFSLSHLASELNCSLNAINVHFRSKDDIAEMLFDKADQVMLANACQENFNLLSSDDRLLECILCWFDSLSVNKKLVQDILLYKLEPGHFHLQSHGITRISRTVQWFREASTRKQQGLEKVADELTITSAYLASFSFFLFDKSRHHSETRKLLKRLLENLRRAKRCFTSFSNRYHYDRKRCKNRKSLN